MSASSGYVAIPRCPEIFDGANYPDFAAFMRIHMRGLRLWGVMSGKVSCPPCPVAPTAPPPTPPTLAADARRANQEKAKSEDDAAMAAYDWKAHEYFCRS